MPLFTIAEARAFDNGRLVDDSLYPDADITAAEVAIRAFLAEVCEPDFVPTTYTDEYHDGDGTSLLALDHVEVTSVTAASVRSRGATDWTALTADELASIQVGHSGIIDYEDGIWPVGHRTAKVTYVAGLTAVPEVIKDAALRILVFDLMPSSFSDATAQADYDGVTASFSIGDGFNGNWHAIPAVRRAIRLYPRRPGIA